MREQEDAEAGGLEGHGPPAHGHGDLYRLSKEKYTLLSQDTLWPSAGNSSEWYYKHRLTRKVTVLRRVHRHMEWSTPLCANQE